jgi:hypothetical protein
LNEQKFIGKFIILILLISCSENQDTLEKYANYPVKFAKQKIDYPNNEFSIIIPKNWKWKVENFENENIISGIDITSETDKKGFINIISIQKINSFGESKTLKSEFEYCLKMFETNWQKSEIIDSGETNILNYKSYYIHSKSNNEKSGIAEIISFIIESRKKGEFYYLAVSASKNYNLRKNMSIMIQSLATFEKLKKE